MTIEELAYNLITHSDTEPTCISLEQAERIISHLDRSAPLPDNLTAKALCDSWNTWILFDLEEEEFDRWRK